MSVTCALTLGNGKVTERKTYECFGFMYSHSRAADLFGISTFRLGQEYQELKNSKYIHYYRDPFEVTETVANKYLSMLEFIGIRNVLEFPQAVSDPLDVHNTLEVVGDLHKHPAQAIIGAFELIRNAVYHPKFVETVVLLRDYNVTPDVALHVTRAFTHVNSEEIDLPYADTTQAGLRNLKQGGHVLFSDKILSNPLKMKLWKDSGTFDGVFRFYSGVRSDKIKYGTLSAGYALGLERHTSLYEAAHNQRTPDPLDVRKCYNFLQEVNRIRKNIPMHMLAKIAKHYAKTGEFL